MIKRIILCVALVCMVGCASMYPVPPAPICGKPEAESSVICAISAKIGTTPEQMNDMLLDATLIPIAAKVVSAQELKDAVGKVQKYVKEKDVLSVKGIVAYLVVEAKVDPALAMLLSRRLVFLQVPGLETQALLPFDKELVLSHLQNQMDQLSFF